MKPPICKICDRDFVASISEGGLVYFKLTEADIQYNKRFEQLGFVGHPAGQAWFCRDHYKMAKKLSGLSKGEELKKFNLL